MLSSGKSNCISIRARVRKSRRAIDPEFDECRETLVSFVPKNNIHPGDNGGTTVCPIVVAGELGTGETTAEIVWAK